MPASPEGATAPNKEADCRQICLQGEPLDPVLFNGLVCAWLSSHRRLGPGRVNRRVVANVVALFGRVRMAHD